MFATFLFCLVLDFNKRENTFQTGKVCFIYGLFLQPCRGLEKHPGMSHLLLEKLDYVFFWQIMKLLANFYSFFFHLCHL